MGAREPESETSFTCALCGFESRIDYIGNRPPWAPSVVFRERAYILRDPTNAATNHPLCIGASCSVWCDGTAGPAQPLTLTPTRLPQLKGCLRRAGVLALLHSPALRGVPNSDGDPPRATRRASQGLIAGLRVIRDVDAEIGRARVRSAIDRRRRRRTIVLVDKVSISALRAGDIAGDIGDRRAPLRGPLPERRSGPRPCPLAHCRAPARPRAHTGAISHETRTPDPPPMRHGMPPLWPACGGHQWVSGTSRQLYSFLCDYSASLSDWSLAAPPAAPLLASSSPCSGPAPSGSPSSSAFAFRPKGRSAFSLVPYHVS